MSKILTGAVFLLMTGIQAVASDNTSRACTGTEGSKQAMAKAEAYARQQGFQKPKNLGVMFFSKDRNNMIVLFVDKADTSHKTLHLLVPFNADKCVVNGEVHE